MILFFRAIARLFVLAFAYMLATIAGMAILTLSIIGWRAGFGGLDFATPEEEIVAFFFSGTLGFIAFLDIVVAAAAPAAVLGLIAEAFSLRSVFAHVTAGGTLGLYLLLSADAYATPMPPRQDIVIALAAGFAAGFVYWLFAGRKAGDWRVGPRGAPLSGPE